MIDRLDLRKKLPYGYGKIVAKRANVSENAVSMWFCGKINSNKIEDAVLDLFAELNNNRNKKLKAAGLL